MKDDPPKIKIQFTYLEVCDLFEMCFEQTESLKRAHLYHPEYQAWIKQWSDLSEKFRFAKEECER